MKYLCLVYSEEKKLEGWDDGECQDYCESLQARILAAAPTANDLGCGWRAQTALGAPVPRQGKKALTIRTKVLHSLCFYFAVGITASAACPTGARASSSETVLWNFKGGFGVQSGLTAGKKGVFYGTTFGGGVHKGGTVFELTPPAPSRKAWTKRVLWDFSGPVYSRYLDAELVSDKNGILYGATSSISGHPTVFKLMPPKPGKKAWSLRTLWKSRGGGAPIGPVGRLIADQYGALYGTTMGSAGTVFKLAPPRPGKKAWTKTVLWTFPDGVYSQNGLIMDDNGVLYGVTENDGMGLGTVFSLAPPVPGQETWTHTVLWVLGQPDGFDTQAPLLADKDGALYTTTGMGGILGWGAVFKLTPPGPGQTDWTHAVLWSFGGSFDGGLPRGGLIADQHGALYGVTMYGGTHDNAGTAFKLTPPGPGETAWTKTVLWSFGAPYGDGCPGVPVGCPQGASDGVAPLGLIADVDGTLYGTTQHGGRYGGGTAFKLELGIGMDQ
ncbi:choice-of-anchor tandem repeat GloVer-containing protein [Methylococcus mesophilus]|uniref:choice-of-anchor tandem repeat GloVer-containing protein n=1 Tax=Methylococcus mesophilus TaxID=2993564 RepID=UPI00224B3BD4|nr:choice-of-anchor tandem repeat GloVer-containing protein [Methylococcus mesophilus]UZR29943.1 hypothetical protein OOT43_04710 [Methylococcus mesophilus]